MDDTRIRFSKTIKGNIPKNTLVTVREGDTVYFGISRCNLRADQPSKKAGVHIARQRAEVATRNIAGLWYIDGTFYLHKYGVFGQVHMDEIQKLLTHFDNVDEIALKWEY